MNQPSKIRLKDDGNLLIMWENNKESVIPSERLRRLCPCASCVIERERESRNYIPIYNKDQITINSLKPVGSYAIAISWKDGHSTGIYEYSYLKLLSVERSAG